MYVGVDVSGGGGDNDGVTDGLDVDVAVTVKVCEAVGERVDVGLPVAVGVAVAVPVWVGVRVWLGIMVIPANVGGGVRSILVGTVVGVRVNKRKAVAVGWRLTSGANLNKTIPQQ